MVQFKSRKQGVKKMKQIKKTKKQESGRSMIEMVGVLAVMGLITAGAFVLISSAMRSQKLSRADDDVSAIAAGIRLLYNSQENFANLTSSALSAIGFDATNANPYGGAYYTNVASPTTKFYVGIQGLTVNEAKALTARKWPGGGDTVQCCKVASNNWTCSANCATDANAVRITYDKVQQ